MQYRIIKSFSSVEALEALVHDYIQAGWTPLGGVSVATGNISWTGLYCQAMTKED